MSDIINIENQTVTLPDLKTEAKIILDWDDGQWYISSIQGTDSAGNTLKTSSAVDTTSGVKVAVWDKDYKYNEDDIVGYSGKLYVSKQNQNQTNKPNDGKFWWYPIVDLSNVDAVTLEGRNLKEIIRDVLGGNVITDYYKKSETDSIILTQINNVNAKKISGWTLDDIKDDYNTIISASKSAATTEAITYFTDEGIHSYQQSLVDEFNEAIADDNINQLG